MMLRITRFVPLAGILAAGMICAQAPFAQAQQQGGNVGTNNNIGTSGTGSNATTQGQTSAAEDFSLDRPALTTDIEELTQEMQSGFVGTSDLNTEFFGVNAAGENASNQTNRQFNRRTTTQNLNQTTQRQPLYRTFGPNNVPYRSPHRISFQVNRPRDRSPDLTLVRNVRILHSRRPQFSDVQFVFTADNTVTLRGSVASEDDRKMAMLYVKMEPGVDRVVSELQVSSVDPTPLIPPAPPSAGTGQ